MNSIAANPLQEVLAKLPGAKHRGGNWEARCPAHEDRLASLSVSTGDDGRVLLKCHAGCKTDAIVTAIGMRMSDLFVHDRPGRGNGSGKPRITKIYDYRDAEGELRFQCVRLEPKSFRQRRPDTNGGFIWNLNDIELVPYKLPELINSREDRPDDFVFICEGEKDVDRMYSIGLIATCNPMGAGQGKWRDSFSEQLRDRNVVIIADKDEPGRKHARYIAESLRGIASSVRIIELPGGAVKDASDFISAGGTAEKIIELAQASTVVPAADHGIDGNGHAVDEYGNLSDEDRRAVLGLQREDIKASRRPMLIRASDVVVEEIEWLWHNRFALGKASMIAGDPDRGKTTIAIDMTARITTGSPWPDGSGNAPMGSVIWMSAEDGIGDTLRPRLDRAGADVNKVIFLRGFYTTAGDGSRREQWITLADLDLLADAIHEVGDCRAIIIDPAAAYMPEGLDANSNTDVRGVMGPLCAMLEKEHVALIMISHLSKSGPGKAVYRSMGSIAWIASCRSAYLVARDKNDSALGKFVKIKNNLAPPMPGLAFRLHDGAVCWEHGTINESADDLMADEQDHRGEGEAIVAAMEWLEELLATGPMSAAEVKKNATAAGMSTATVNRAKTKLRIKPYREQYTGGWFWKLPETVVADPEPVIPEFL